MKKSSFAFTIAMAFAGLAHADDFVGPPLLTEVGCRADREWTQEYVAGVLNVEEVVMRRIKRRANLTPAEVCALTKEGADRMLRWGGDPRRNFDQPDKAMEYRLLSLVDESGTVKPEGMALAIEERQERLRSQRGPLGGGITSGVWTGLGPGNVGGRVRAIAPHPTTANRIIAGSVSGGIWKTTNGGTSWTQVNDFMANVAISCLVHDPVTPSTMYACTGEGAGNVDNIRGLGIFKSTDAGDTWTLMASTDPVSAGSQWYFVNRLAIHPTTPNVMLAATNSGVYRTDNGGTSWTDVYGSIPGFGNRRRVYDVKFNTTGSAAVLGEHRHFDPAAGGTQIGGNAVAWSTNGGQTWTRVPLVAQPLASGTNFGRVELALSASTNFWYASVDHDPDTVNAPAAGQIYKSVDGGQAWSFVSQPGHLSGQGWYDNTIWVAPNDDTKIMAGGVPMHMSVNGGAAFTQIASSVHVDHHALVSHPLYASNGIVYNGNDGGIYRFDNVHTVTVPSGTVPAATNLNNGLAITQFYGGHGGTIPATRLAGGTQDNGSYVYNGTTWSFVFGGDGAEGQVDPTDSNYSYGEVQYLNIHRNTTGGASQSSYICMTIIDSNCPGGPAKTLDTNFIAPIALDPSDPNRLYGGGAQLWRTLNAKDPTAGNVVFTSIKPKTAPLTNGGLLNFIAVAPSNPNVIWVGQNNGNVYRTVDGLNATPTWTANLSPVAGRQVTRILIDPVDPARVLLAFGGFSANNVQLTTNGLDAVPTWTARAGSGGTALPSVPVRALARHPSTNLWLYAGTEIGLYTSEDGGATWNTTNDGPGTVSVEEIFFLNANTMIASTHGRGMFQATVTAPPVAGILTLSTSTVAAAEGTTATIDVTRTGGSTGAVSVTVNTANVSATAPTDYTAIVNQVLSWANGDSANKQINIPILSDGEVEAAQTFTVTLSGVTGGASLGTPSSATVTINDADQFPFGCSIPTGWVQAPGSNASWSIATDQKFEGSCSLKSNPIADGQKAEIQFNGTFNAGNITFRRRVHSENAWDFFRFYIDGVEQGPTCTEGVGTCSGATVTGATASGTPPDTASGPTEWNQPAGILSFPITAGSHTVKFSYQKDVTCCFQGADAAWVDSITFPQNFTLTVSRNGTGTGTVTSAPGGINCGVTCSAGFASGGNVTLTATPDAGSTFTGWSGSGCSGTGTCVVPMHAARSATATFTLSAVSAKLSDFNLDGRSDVLWRDTTAGLVYQWQLNGLNIGAQGYMVGVPTSWSVVGLGDASGDGRTDVLWRDTGGQNYLWVVNGLTLPSQGYMPSVPAPWVVVGMGDTNADSRADVLWRNPTTGANYLWILNGLNVTSQGYLPSVAGTDWEVAAMADFTGDGRADVLWRNKANGLIYLWVMNGLNVTSQGYMPSVPTDWEVVGAPDTNNDGRADVLWRHKVNGMMYLWQMNGLALSGQGYLLQVADANWKVVGYGDYDGDGRGDVLWRNAANGTNYLWLMNGLNVASQGYLPNVTGINWKPITR